MLNTKEIREDFAAETSYSIAIEKRDPFETFAHYRIGKGLATLSVSVDEGVVSVGAAYCHPRDKMNKSFGRKVALARRELGSDFSFEFKRDDTRFTEQLRHEFNNFVEASRDEYVHALQYGQKNRVGSPPWIMFALHRQLKKQKRILTLVA